MKSKVLFQNLDAINKLYLEFLNKTQESIEKDIDTIIEWVKGQPHLPEVPTRHCISNFLKMHKCSIELTKKQIDMYYTLRSFMPDVFENSHPKLKHMQEVTEKVHYLTLPQLTEEGNCITIVSFNQLYVNEIPNYFHALAHALNIAEIRLAEEISLRDVVIFDCEGFGMAHVLKLTPTFLKQLSLIYTEMYSSRICQIHLVNCPVSEVLVKLLKTFLSQKLSERIIVHDEFEKLFNYVPRKIFPKDYGGEEMSIEELKNVWNEKLVEYYPRFEELSKMRIKEELRPIPLKNDEVLGYYGNFKKLDVD